MRILKYIFVVFALFSLWVPAAAAKEIESVTMVSLADNFNPWTITVKSDGRLEWNDSSSGYLLDSIIKTPDEVQRKTLKVSQAEVARLFKMVSEAGYLAPVGQFPEPKVRLIVKFNDGTKTLNSGPAGLPDENKKDREIIKAFREVERAMVTAAGFDYKAEAKKYKEFSSEPYIFLFYSVVYEDL